MSSPRGVGTAAGLGPPDEHPPLALGMLPDALEVHIETVELEGFDAVDRLGVVEGVRNAAETLLAERGLALHDPRRWAAESIDAGEVVVEPYSTAQELGETVGGAIYRSLNR